MSENVGRPLVRLLIKERQSGKTTGLIYASEATGYPIATANEGMVKLIKDRAAEIGCTIPTPVTFYELRNWNGRGTRLYDTVLIDEVEGILGAALNEYLHCDVKCATLSNTLKEFQKHTIK